MAVPAITPLPTPPNRQSAAAEFTEQADEFLGALPQFQVDTNNVASYAEQMAGEAETARDKSAQWADAPKGTEVEPGRYSALHYAEHAEEQVQLATDQVALAEAQVQLATDEADRAAGEANEASLQAINAAQSAAAAEAAGGMGNLAILQATALSF